MITNSIREKCKTCVKKEAFSVVKSAICFALCLLFFIFAFCPIVSVNDESNVGITGIDYIAIMGYAAKKYDPITDADAIDEQFEKIDALYTELSENTNTPKYSMPATPSYKARRLQHKIVVETAKMSASIKGDDHTRTYLIGIASLIYILASTAMLVVSSVGFAFSLVQFQSHGQKQVKFWYEYTNLLPIFLFLSLLLSFGFNVGVNIAATMICRLLFECIAIVLIGVDALMESENRYQSVSKMVALALCIIVVGVCFAPCFSNTNKFEIENGKECSVKTKDAAYLFLSSAVNEDRYEIANNAIRGNDYVTLIRFIIESDRSLPQNETHDSGASTIVGYVFLDEYGQNGNQGYGAGYCLMIVAILLIGVYACLAQFDSKNCVTARRVILIIALVSFAVALILGGVMCGKVNKYMDDNDIVNFKMSLDAGLICATLFAIGTVVCDFLPNTIEKKRGKKEQLVQVQE